LLEFQIPRLRDCKGPLTVQQNLAAELREDVDVLGRQIETLDVLVGDQKGERNRRELRRTVDGFLEALTNLRKDARAALLSSKRAIDSQSMSQREELLRSSVLKDKQELDEKAGDDALMKASNDVTDALRRTIGLMQGELERSVLTTQMLDTSTATLRSTSATHDTLTTVMGTSKQLITALEKSDWLDRLLIMTGLVFFFLVVLLILKQRIIDRGLRIALWWTRFLPSGDIDLDILEKGEGVMATAVAVASSVTTSASLALAGLSQTVSGVPKPYDGATVRDEDPSVSAVLLPSLSSVLSAATELPRTTDPLDTIHDEL